MAECHISYPLIFLNSEKNLTNPHYFAPPFFWKRTISRLLKFSIKFFRPLKFFQKYFAPLNPFLVGPSVPPILVGEGGGNEPQNKIWKKILNRNHNMASLTTKNFWSNCFLQKQREVALDHFSAFSSICWNLYGKSWPSFDKILKFFFWKTYVIFFR